MPAAVVPSIEWQLWRSPTAWHIDTLLQGHTVTQKHAQTSAGTPAYAAAQLIRLWLRDDFGKFMIHAN